MLRWVQQFLGKLVFSFKKKYNNKAQNYLNSLNPEKKLLTSLLVAEACIYHCPFKKEHDSIGEVIGTEYFRGPADLSCNAWRSVPGFSESPRSGVNVVANDVSTLTEFADLVDIFKYSGRLTSTVLAPSEAKFMKAVWFYGNTSKFKQNIGEAGSVVYADNFEDIAANNLIPMHDWIPGWIDTRHTKEDWRTTYKTYDGIWSTEPGRKLEKVLKNCKNQCWDCHKCERTFGFQDIDSALQMRKMTQ
jgi:hypothetical protein